MSDSFDTAKLLCPKAQGCFNPGKWDLENEPQRGCVDAGFKDLWMR